MKPFFSVVISSLNEEKYLPKLLEDLKKQKERNFEVIIVDGHSNDNTVNVAKKTFPEVKVIISKVRNLCYQRNLGARNSEGEYLVFLDADIRLYKTYLSEIRNTIKANSYLFLTTYLLPDALDRFDIFLVQITNFTLEIMKLFNKQMAPGFNFIVDKNLFLRLGGFNEKVTISEDHELSLRILKSGVKLWIIPKRLMKWSFRRIRRDGYLNIILKYSIASVYTVALGEITDKKLGYQMGGHLFEGVRNQKVDKKIEPEIKRYAEKIRRLLKKIF